MNKENLLSIVKSAPYGDGHVFGNIMLPEVMDLLVNHLSDSINPTTSDDRPLATMLHASAGDRTQLNLDMRCGLCENLVFRTDKFCASCGAEFYTG